MKRPDLTVPLGIVIGLCAVGGAALLEGISLRFLWQPRAALVVFGGTLGAVVVRCGLSGVRAACAAALRLCVKDDAADLNTAVARLYWLARAAKREGVRALEQHAATTSGGDPLVARALRLTVEYAPPAIVRATLDRMLDAEDERGGRDAATVEAAGGFAPTFGIVGAVLGLVAVLRSLEDPGALGAGIATAFVATLYGVGLANIILFPVAARLRARHAACLRRREALADALVAFAAQDSLSAINTAVAAYTELEAERRPAATANARPRLAAR